MDLFLYNCSTNIDYRTEAFRFVFTQQRIMNQQKVEFQHSGACRNPKMSLEAKQVFESLAECNFRENLSGGNSYARRNFLKDKHIERFFHKLAATNGRPFGPFLAKAVKKIRAYLQIRSDER